MREYSVPATVTVSGEDNLSDMVFATAERFGGSVLYRRKVRDTWVDVTAREFAAQVLAVAKGLIAAGVEPGDRVALLSRTRYEWTLADYAIWTAGAVTVPIYETSSAEQVDWILSDSGARGIFIETAAHAEIVQSVRGNIPALAHAWQFDDDGLMTIRHASINDVGITNTERLFHWDRAGSRPEDHPGPSELGF